MVDVPLREGSANDDAIALAHALSTASFVLRSNDGGGGAVGFEDLKKDRPVASGCAPWWTSRGLLRAVVGWYL